MGKDYKDLQVGNQFEINESKRVLLRERVRAFLTVCIAIGSAIALGVAAVVAAVSGDAGALLKVWAVVAVPITAATTFYFKGRNEGEKNID